METVVKRCWKRNSPRGISVWMPKKYIEPLYSDLITNRDVWGRGSSRAFREGDLDPSKLLILQDTNLGSMTKMDHRVASIKDHTLDISLQTTLTRPHTGHVPNKYPGASAGAYHGRHRAITIPVTMTRPTTALGEYSYSHVWEM
ncbi:hypothetical protein Pcinc_023493 [Petrolisthes cinctipes]|uniref:Uncharacterized protein n=1 Tax=Petrolisthes cinctipes TaxID=88211 RepID=A0AAE1FD52_PETCI|nr:hypothetical protein Pcinc_023493 [Petrolisthes cinctipes]